MNNQPEALTARDGTPLKCPMCGKGPIVRQVGPHTAYKQSKCHPSTK
jgi:predicted RNA-binding Zn-ribbon protein involved in translation (DUF1610 family)